MAHIIVDRNELFGQWAASLIPAVGAAEKFGPHYRAFGVTTGNTPDAKVMAAIVYHDHQAKFGTCQMSFAAADPRWASRNTVRALLAIPFYQFGIWKVWVCIPHTAERTIKLAKALGFTSEATLSDQFGRGTHAVICRMKLPQYERLYWPDKQAKAA